MSDLGLEIVLEDLDTGKRNSIDRWMSYSVVQDLHGVDTFEAEIAAVESQRAFTSHGGQLATVTCYGALQCTAIMDERSEAVNTTNTDLKISGRGVGALLIDSSVAPAFLSLNNKTLQKVVERIVSPYFPAFITNVTTNMQAAKYIVAGGQATNTVRTGPDYNTFGVYPAGHPRAGQPWVQKVTPTKKISNPNYKAWGKNSPLYRGVDQESLKHTRIQPGEKIWEVITRLCAQVASHPYVAADGNLVIMRPQYKFQSNAYGDGIVLKWDQDEHKATGGNVKRGQFETTIADRNSEYIVWGTGKQRKVSVGKELKQSITIKDPSPAFWTRTETSPFVGTPKISKPTIIPVKNIKDPKLLRRMARGMMEDAAIKGFSLDYEINTHHINGVLPTVDTMIRVDDDRFNLHDSFYITKVVRRFGFEGRSTILSLIPPDIWMAVDHDTMTDDNEYLGYMAQRIFW